MFRACTSYKVLIPKKKGRKEKDDTLAVHITSAASFIRSTHHYNEEVDSLDLNAFSIYYAYRCDLGSCPVLAY